MKSCFEKMDDKLFDVMARELGTILSLTLRQLTTMPIKDNKTVCKDCAAAIFVTAAIRGARMLTERSDEDMMNMVLKAYGMACDFEEVEVVRVGGDGETVH